MTIVTSQELTKLIEHYTVYGEYDEYHEWSLFYSLKDKLNFLDAMLKNRDNTEPLGKKIILQRIRDLIKEAGSNEENITNILTSYIHIPEILNWFLSQKR